LCLTWTVNANSLKTKQYSYYRNSYFLGCHLGWVNKRFRIQKVAAKNIIISLITTTLIAILKTPSGSISLNSWLLHHIINCSKYLPHIKHTQSAIYSSETIVRHITTTSVFLTIFPVNLKAYLSLSVSITKYPLPQSDHQI